MEATLTPDTLAAAVPAALSPAALFGFANPLALGAWLVLAAAPFAPRFADLVAGLIVPLVLSVGYTALMLAHFAGAPGGYGSLADVMALFTSPPVALAGWVHYLAFDLFVGAWIVRTARAEAVPHLLVLPCLVATFLFGPAGFLAFQTLRAGRSAALVTREA